MHRGSSSGEIIFWVPQSYFSAPQKWGCPATGATARQPLHKIRCLCTARLLHRNLTDTASQPNYVNPARESHMPRKIASATRLRPFSGPVAAAWVVARGGFIYRDDRGHGHGSGHRRGRRLDRYRSSKDAAGGLRAAISQASTRRSPNSAPPMDFSATRSTRSRCPQPWRKRIAPCA